MPIDMVTIFAVILTVAMLAVIYLDTTRFLIPNWLNLTLLAVFLVWGFVAPHMDWLSALYMFLALFAAGYLMFAFHIMGGGDVKLLAVCGLFVGWGQAGISFIFYTAILGGLLSLLVLALRFLLPPICARLGGKSLPALFTMGEPVPYGLAIAGAFLLLLWRNHLPGLVIG